MSEKIMAQVIEACDFCLTEHCIPTYTVKEISRLQEKARELENQLADEAKECQDYYKQNIAFESERNELQAKLKRAVDALYSIDKYVNSRTDSLPQYALQVVTAMIGNIAVKALREIEGKKVYP